MVVSKRQDSALHEKTLQKELNLLLNELLFPNEK